MSIIQGIFLGVLQGISEFLPISSSGHLAVAQHLLGLGAIPLLFDVFLHVATLCATVLYFRKKIWKLIIILIRWIMHRPISAAAPAGEVCADGLSGTEQLGRKTIIAVILATVITGIMGVVSSRIIPELPLRFVSAGFLLTAVLLVVSSFAEKKRTEAGTVHGVSWLQSLGIGFAQGIGTLPGISRSGSTIAGALLCGVDRVDAGEFSFIVSIPAIIGAFLLELKDLGSVASGIGAAPIIAGCAAAFASGFLALTWLMKLIRKGRLEWFACYLIPVGILGILFLN